MPQLFKYPVGSLFLNDYIIGTDIVDPAQAVSSENVTRNFNVNQVVNAMLHAINIGTVTSISTASSTYITATAVPNPIIATGSITLGLNATGLATDLTTKKLQYLRGDNTWSLPGPTPTDVQVSSFGVPLTTDMSSINFTGNVIATGGIPGYITVDFPGTSSLIDSIIAGAGITVVDNVGAITISNSGVIQVRAGGNITLSGGTSNVTISTVANAGTVTIVNPGTGIATITNSSSNPELDVEYTGNNNYIAGNLSAEVIDHNDIINYLQITSSSVKSTQLRDIPANILTTLKTYIDSADLNKIKNVEPTGFDETAKAKYMVTCTLNEYNAIATKDVNTLYFIVGAGISYTQNLTLDITGITGSTNYSVTTLANGVAGTSVTGPAGTAFTFYITITGTNGATISNSNMPMTIPGNIVVNGGTSNAVLTATVTNAAGNSVRAALASVNFGISGNLNASGAKGTVWDYAPYATPGFYNRPPDASGYPTYSVDPNFGFAPDNGSGYVYTFNPRLEILNTTTYKWISGSADSISPKYLKDGYGSTSGVWSNTWLTGTVFSTQVEGQTNINTTIEGTWENIPYSAVLTVVDNVTAIDSVTGSTVSLPTYNFNIQSLLPTTSFGTTITGLNNVSGDALNSYSWSTPGIPNISDSNYAWTTNPTFTFSPAGTQTISGANGAVTLTIAGQITYTAPATNFTLIVKYKKTIADGGGENTIGSIILNGTGQVAISPVDGTTIATLQGASYTVPLNNIPFQAAVSEGYYFSTAFNATPDPIVGTAPNTGTSANINSVLTGEINLILATPSVTQTVYVGNPVPEYQINFSGSNTPGKTPTATFTLFTISGDTSPVVKVGSTFAVGNGDCVFTVSKTSDGGLLAGDLTITWPDGNTYTLGQGNYLTAQQVTINTASFQTSLAPLITIDEATPTSSIITTLVVDTSGITGTGTFTNSGDPNGSQNVAAANAGGQTFTVDLVADSTFQFMGSVVYSVGGTTLSGNTFTYTQPSANANITILAEAVITPISVTMELRYNDTIIVPAGSGTPYTLNPAPSTITGNVGDSYSFGGSITATPDTDYVFDATNQFNAAQQGSNGLSGYFPANGGFVDYTLTGTIEDEEYSVTLTYDNQITGGTLGVEYTLASANATPVTGIVGASYDFTTTPTMIGAYSFTTPFSATQTSGTLPITGTIPSGGGNAKQDLTGVITANPILYRTTLVIVINVAGSEYTLTGDTTGDYKDAVAGAPGLSFNITAPANTCYPTQGCNYHWVANNNNPILSLTAGGAGVSNPVTYIQPAYPVTFYVYLSGTIAPDPVMSLNYVNNIVGAPASQGGTPPSLPDTSGLYTLSPGPLSAVNSNANPGTAASTWQAPEGDPWNITLPGPNGSIQATPATNYSFSTTSPFAFTKSGTYALWGTSMPVNQLSIAEYTLTGQVVRSSADIQIFQNSATSTARFSATFAATGGATRTLSPNNSNCSTLPCTITTSGFDAGLLTGNAGQVTITVVKTTNSGITQHSGSILYGDSSTAINFPNNYNTITDPSNIFTHTIASLGSLVYTDIYSVSVVEG